MYLLNNDRCQGVVAVVVLVGAAAIQWGAEAGDQSGSLDATYYPPSQLTHHTDHTSWPRSHRLAQDQTKASQAGKAQ